MLRPFYTQWKTGVNLYWRSRLFSPRGSEIASNSRMRTLTRSKLAKHTFGHIAVFVLAFFAQCHVCAQTVATRLDQSKEFNTQSTTLSGQLVDLAQTYGIPMGLELVAGNDKPLKPLHIKNEKALGVLGKILQAQPGYEFDLSDGVVSVYSTRLFNDDRNFLNLILGRYRINDESLFGAWHYLRTAIKQTLHPDRNYGGGFGGFGGDSLDIANLTFSGDNLTVRQILNRLVAMHDGALWMVHLSATRKMSDEPFYSQAYATTGSSSPDFYWEFLPLR
jgi:hypothetical protein